MIATAFLLLASCSQRESDVGRRVLQSAPEDTFIVRQGVAADALEWSPNISNGRGSTLQVGDIAGFFAFTAIRFDPEPEISDDVRVDEVYMLLDRNRIAPETNAPDLPVRVREIPERWTEDSLLTGYLADRESYEIIDSLVISSSQTTIRHPLPETWWSRWLAGDSTFGLLIEPRSSGAMFGFFASGRSDSAGAAVGPRLEVVGWKPPTDSIGADTVFYLQIVAKHDAYIAFDGVDAGPGRLVLRQGQSQRAALYFPLDTLAVAYERTVAHAELLLYADTAHVANFLYSGTNLLYRDGTMASSAWRTVPDSARAGLVATSSSRFDTTNSYIRFDVTSTVSFWVANPEENTGFQIVPSEENGHLTRQVFHSPQSEVEHLKPRLVIWFAEQH